MRGRLPFGVLNVLVAGMVTWGLFRGLPARWWPVDFTGSLIALVMGVSGVALLADHRHAVRITRVAAGIALVIGLAVFAAIALTASWLAGVYGPVGRGGAAIFGVVAALVLPYLVLLPAAELLWVGPRQKPGP